MKGAAVVVLSLAVCHGLAAQGWDVERSPTGDATRLEFVTTEGTWMSVDVAPDGASIVFDLLGHLYEIPFAGGDARPLTQGRSWNMFPRYSPDGRRIAFTSDRGGVDNIWVLERASERLTSVSRAKAAPVFRASWAADGGALYAAAIVDSSLTSKVLRLGLDGTVRTLVGRADAGPLNQFSDDPRRGRVLFEHNDQDLYQSGARIKAYDTRTGETTVVIERPGGAFNPVVSPDGRLLAYLNRDDQKTRLIIRDLETRHERALTDGLDRDRQEHKLHYHGAYTNMAWHPNSRELVLSFGGGLRVVDVGTGAVRPVSFRAPVSRQVARALRFPTPVPQGESRSRTHRWAQRTKRGILYETLGDLYLRHGSEARNLTASSAHETSPLYDARTGTLYYASWTDDELGAVFSRKLTGGQPVRLTSRPAQYGALTLTPDGSTLLFLRGSGGGLVNGLQLLDEERDFELVALGADRRERRITDLRWRRGISVGSYPPPALTVDTAGNVYFPEFSGDTLLLRRVPLQGGEKTTLYRFPHAVYATVSPDLRRVVFQERHRSYVVPFKYAGRPLVASGADPEGGARRVDARDGFFHTWQDAQTLQWTRGKEFLEKSVSEVLNGRSSARSTDVSVPFRVAAPTSTIALRGVRVITMRTPDEVVEEATVLVEGSRVRAVGRDVAIPAGARVLDLRGHTVMPGIIDVHAHPGDFRRGLGLLNVIEQRPAGHAAALAHGVTTMYEVAGTTLMDFWLSDMTLKGGITGPRFYSVGDLMLGFHDGRFKPSIRSIQSLADARAHAAINKAHGATALKDYVNYPRATRQQLIMAANELGLNVVAEPGGHGQTNLTRVVDGFTGLAHHWFGLTPLYGDVVRLFAVTGTGVTLTLVSQLGGTRGEDLFYTTERVWENDKLLRFWSKDRLLESRRAVHVWADDRYLPQMGQSLKKLFAAGVPVNLGAHGEMLGLDAHWEMELFTQAGFTPLQTIQFATRNPARHQGLDRELGSIEAGKLADLIVLRANPLENIRHTREIHMVMRNGVLYSGADLARVYPDPQPAGRMYFHR